MIIVKALKTGSGKWAVFYGSTESTDGKATKLAYQRWFNTEAIAQKWAEKWKRTNKLTHA